MAYEEKELEEVTLANAVSSFETVLIGVTKPVIDYSELAEWIVLPQVDDLDVLQSRQMEMWECYTALKRTFALLAAAPVDADGELK